MKPSDSGAEVLKIAPDGRMSLVPTTLREDIKRNVGLQLGGAALFRGVTAKGTAGWGKAVSGDTSNQTTVVGSVDLKGRNWTSLDNQTAKTVCPDVDADGGIVEEEG